MGPDSLLRRIAHTPPFRILPRLVSGAFPTTSTRAD